MLLAGLMETQSPLCGSLIHETQSKADSHGRTVTLRSLHISRPLARLQTQPLESIESHRSLPKR